jgi:hypothetical protein
MTQPVRRVALWDASSTMGYADLFDTEHVTDVFLRDSTPVKDKIVMVSCPRMTGPR